MGTLKTLGQIANHLNPKGRKSPNTPTATPCPLKTKSCISTDTAVHAPAQAKREAPQAHDILRQTLKIKNTPFEIGRRLTLAEDRNILIIGTPSDLTEALTAEFSQAGQNALVMGLDTTDTALFASAGGVVILAPETHTDDFFIKQTFELTRQCAPALLEATGQGNAFFATVSRLDGAFGFSGQAITDPLQGALAGLAKTAALEWPDVHCKALDLEPHWHAHQEIAVAIVREVLNRDLSSKVEIGLGPDARRTLELTGAPLYVPEITLSPKDLFLISGGARGVTAAAAVELAKHGQPTLILIGRSQIEKSEPEWLASLSDEKTIKKAIIKNQFPAKIPTPAAVDKLFKKIMAHREIRSNLDAIRTAGARVSYFAANVRNLESIQNLIAQVHQQYGPITGIVHGAGILEDRLIIEKTNHQFNRVFDTKVKGLAHLLAATSHDPVNHIVLFSSVAARMGNVGQADYAMANEALNKIARTEAAVRPDCKVVSINWGPWDGGMVSPSLKRAFQKRGISLIPVKAGTRCMLREMNAPKDTSVEIVMGAGLVPEKTTAPDPAIKKKTNQKRPPLFLSFERDVDVNRYPILASHVLDGKPVVPFALMAEWLGHGALHGNPGLFFSGIDDMRLLKGIQLDQRRKAICLMAGKLRKKGKDWEVDVEIRDAVNGGREVIHSRARAILTDTPARPAPFDTPERLNRNGYTRSMTEIYDKILFHGSGLHGIEQVTRCTSRDMVARILSAPVPSKWMSQPLRSAWIGDPLVLDAAFQMASLWCYEERGMVSLPSYSARYRQYSNTFPKQGIQALLEITDVNDHKMMGDFTFVDAQNQVIARLNGYEAVMHQSLFKAFRTRSDEQQQVPRTIPMQ